MKKRILAIFAALTVLALTAVVASAETAATVVVSGGSLLSTPASIGFTATLDGTDQVVLDNDATNWTATDPTGTGLGWNVTIRAIDFVNGGGKTITVSNFKVKLDSGTIATVAGNTAPTSAIGSYTALTGVAQKLLSAAADAGMGSYTYVPDFSLVLVAETYAGTYTSTVTVAINSGP